MALTKNLKLHLADDNSQRFDDYVQEQAGSGDGIETPLSNMQIIDDFTEKIYGVSGIVILEAVNWSANACSVVVAELGDNDAIILSPKTRNDKEEMEDTELFVDTDGNEVLFTASKMPLVDIELHYFILRGKGGE